MVTATGANHTRDRAVLAATVFAVLFAQVLLYPGVPTLIEALGASSSVLDAGTWFLGVEFLGFVLFAAVWGALSDALGTRRPFVALGALGGALGYGLLATLGASGRVTFTTVLLFRFLQGAFTIGAFSLAITMLTDLEGGTGRNMGAAGIAIGGGTALGAPIGGRLYAIDTLAPLWVASACLALVAGLSFAVTDRVPDADSDSEGPIAALAALRRTPVLALPYAFGLIDRLAAGFFAFVGTIYFQTRFGVDAATTGLLLGAFFAPFALLQYPSGILSDRIGRVGPIAVGSGLFGFAVIAVGFAPSVLLAGATMALVGVFGALCAPATLALVSDLAAENERGTAIGGFNIVGSLGFLAGITGGALLTDAAGFDAAFLVVGLAEVAIALGALPFLLRLDVSRVRTFDRG
ncbi:MFS transporter [Halobacteriales archaeon QS_3_64_16]|nr:MAG: MFS transporter [Halobacteriales archaeon QS_3_64_16]